MQFKYQAACFDMDGTLVDNFIAIYKAYSFAAETLGLEVLSYDALKNAVGGGLSVTLSKLMDKKYVEPMLDLYYPYFSEHMFDGAFLLPGVRDILEKLQSLNVRMAVFTNKIGKHSREICTHFGIDKYFELNLGVGDTPFRKPQEAFTQYLLNQLGLPPESCCLIGDSPFDIDAGKSGNLDVYCVSTGSHTLDQLMLHHPKNVYPDMNALSADLLE